MRAFKSLWIYRGALTEALKQLGFRLCDHERTRRFTRPIHRAACPPTARPFIEKGYTGEQAVAYIYYNMPLETADYFKSRGISAELCGPYYAAGVAKEDILTYLDSGYTADQIMPYVRAGVPRAMS